MDQPIRPPQQAAGCFREATPRRAGQFREEAMGERRVSKAPPPVRASERAGAAAVGPQPGLRSRSATAGFLTDYRRLIVNRDWYSNRSDLEIHRDLKLAINRLYPLVRLRFESLGGDGWDVNRAEPNSYVTEQRYRLLQEKARQAEIDGDPARVREIRKALAEIDRRAAGELKALCNRYGQARLPPDPSRPQTPAAATPSASWDWCTAYRRLHSIRLYFHRTGRADDIRRLNTCIMRLESCVKYRFKRSRGKPADLLPFHDSHSAAPQKMYLAIEGMARRAEAAGAGTEATALRRRVHQLKQKMRQELRLLTDRYESLESLAARANGDGGCQAAGSQATPATAPVAATPPPQRADPSPGTGSAGARPSPAGEAAHPASAELFLQPPGPGSRGMPAPEAPAPAPEAPPARRQAIVERFKSKGELFDAELALVCGAADPLCWDDERVRGVRADLNRLNGSAMEDPARTAALPGIDWGGIEALLGIMDAPPQSPSPSPDT